MFPPNNNNPFLKSSLFPSHDLQNPSFTSHGYPPFFFPFPLPSPGDNRINDDMPLSQIFSQRRHLPGPNSVRGGETAEEGKNVIKKKRPAGSGLRRRTGKKDRHSKICTAQGIRDRRMRLSLHVARRFFDLQDMLGFDKASKTIEWLLSQSECAIKELITSSSSCSEEGNNKSEAAEGENVIFGEIEPMERSKEKVMMYEHCSNPIIISPFLDQESNSYGTKENPDPLTWTDEYLPLGGASSTTTKTKTTTSAPDEEKEEDDCNMIIANGSFMGFLGNWEMAPF